MISRAAKTASKACAEITDSDYIVATDDIRIATHCQENAISFVMTPREVSTGSDRALFAAQAYSKAHNVTVDYVLNLQGDAPFTEVSHLLTVREGLETNCDVATPYIQLDWAALDRLREHKKNTPFSGTTIVTHDDNRAIWFSKAILPSIRKEEALRAQGALSPVKRHIGLYGYTYHSLRAFTEARESHYEKLEGLEQLRFIEMGLVVQCVPVSPPRISMPGIDTPEDLALAESLIAKHGDPHA